MAQPPLPPSPPEGPPGGFTSPAPGLSPQFTPPPAGSFGRRPQGPPQPSGEAIGALVCGLMAWSCFPLGFVAIGLGIKARRMVKENPQTVGGDGMALAGMIVGGLISVFMLLFWLAYFGFFAVMFAGMP